MLIGVIADSHDNLPNLERAVELFNEKNVAFVLHAGDYIAPFSIAPLEALNCPWIGVFGNNDGEQAGLTKASRGRIQPAPYELNLDGKKVVVVHDLDSFDRGELIDRGARLIVHGHTHESAVGKKGDVLFVNPGELGGWLVGRATVGLVDTQAMEATIDEIRR